MNDKRQRAYVKPSTGPCGKVGYLTRSEAKTASRQLAPKRGQLLQVYRCPSCEGLPWHLTKHAWRGQP